MTVYGLFNDGTAVLNAAMLRQLVTLLTEGSLGSGGLGANGGVRVTGNHVNALKISPGVTGLTVTASTGMCVVPATTLGAGAYTVVNDAVKTITLATADGSQARIDRIVAQVTDTGAADSTYDIIPVAGTPAGSPAAPATPTNALSLATVLVAAAANSPSGLTVTDTRTLLQTALRPFVGFAMGREEIPTANTTSSSFVTLWAGRFQKRAVNVIVRYLVHTPSGSTGEVRLVLNEIPVQTASIGSASFAYGTFDGAIPTSIDWNALIDAKLHVRLVTGAGPIGVNFISGYTY